MNILGSIGRFLDRKFPDRMTTTEVKSELDKLWVVVRSLESASQKEAVALVTKSCNELSAAIVKLDEQVHTIELALVPITPLAEDMKKTKEDILKIKTMELVRAKARQFPDMSESYRQ